MIMRRVACAVGFALALTACNGGRPDTASDAPASAKRNESVAEAPTSPAPATQDAARQTALVLPGVFAPESTPDSLRQHFGAANVQVGKVPGAEGESFPGVILFPDDPARRAYLYFEDEANLRGLVRVRIADAESTWRLDNGIAIGTTLAELVRRNGKPITYTGLGWDYGGTVQDLHGGALAASQNGPIIRGWRLGAKDLDASAEDAYPIGEGSFDSNDPRYPRQGETVAVNELWLTFPGSEGR